MKRIALLAGVMVVVALLFALRGDSQHETKPGTERTANGTAPSDTIRAAAPSIAGAAPVLKVEDVERANVDGLPEALGAGFLAVEQAAKTCYRGRPAPTPIRPRGPDETIETIQLAYRQVSSNGLGHIEDLKIKSGQLTDQALQSCIVKVAASATWRTAAPDGLIGDLEQNVNLGDLMRPDYGLPPESKRSPKPTAPPPPELAGPLGQPAPAAAEDDHPGKVVSEPGLAARPKK